MTVPNFDICKTRRLRARPDLDTPGDPTHPTPQVVRVHRRRSVFCAHHQLLESPGPGRSRSPARSSPRSPPPTQPTEAADAAPDRRLPPHRRQAPRHRPPNGRPRTLGGGPARPRRLVPRHLRRLPSAATLLRPTPPRHRGALGRPGRLLAGRPPGPDTQGFDRLVRGVPPSARRPGQSQGRVGASHPGGPPRVRGARLGRGVRARAPFRADPGRAGGGEAARGELGRLGEGLALEGDRRAGGGDSPPAGGGARGLGVRPGDRPDA